MPGSRPASCYFGHLRRPRLPSAFPATTVHVPTPVLLLPAMRRPGIASPFTHPVSVMPVVTVAVVLPVARGPHIAGARWRDSFIDRRRWADVDVDVHSRRIGC